ncbi:MAG TPA: hypothetical protein QF624_04320 [Dehalococcoidia bacterium]|nr:hypothetical protein [Dehalococcoidia bacterium]
MQLKLLPNPHRPGVGRDPARENRRTFLPQHARFLPTVEDASTLGFLVYPPLHDYESAQIHARSDNVTAITFFSGGEHGVRGPAFVCEITRSGGRGGIDHVEISIVNESLGYDEASAAELLNAVTVGVNAVPGTIGLRGTHNFITPDGWDSVFVPVLNDLQRPVVGMISTRVETDWLPHETEFRYALEQKDVLSVVGSGPIGQVFFVPREEVVVDGASEAEQQRFVDVQAEYGAETARTAKITDYGAGFSYQYRDHQKARRNGDETPYGLLQDPEASSDQ